MMKKLLIIFSVLFFAASGWAATYTISSLDEDGITDIDGDTFCSGTCQPGDIIVLPSASTDLLRFRDFVGTSGSEIVITNPSDSKTVIDGSSISYGIVMMDSEYFKISGDNYSSETYGIEIDGNSTACVGIRLFRCSNYEIAYIESHHGTGGITHNADQDIWSIGGDWTQSNSRGDCSIHDSYFHDTAGIGGGAVNEAMYLGKTSIGDYSQWDTLELYNLRIDNIGCECMQAGQIESSAGWLKIHNVWMTKCGQDNQSNQNKGFNLSAEWANAQVYAVIMETSNGHGFYAGGAGGGITFHDNTIKDSGNGAGALGENAHGISINGAAGDSIADNRIIDSEDDAIRTGNTVAADIQDNHIVTYGGSAVTSSWTGTVSNNGDLGIPALSDISGANGSISFTTNENAYCRYSDDMFDIIYSDMVGNQFESGENSTSHSQSTGIVTGTTYYFVCVDGDGNESLRSSVEAAAGNVFYGAGRQSSQYGAGRQHSSYGAGIQ